MGAYDWLAAVYDTAIFTAFDTETTGLDPKKGKIIEIGCVKFDLRGEIARYNVLINPLMPIPEAASNVNGISDAMVKNKPAIEDVFPDFLLFIKNTILVAHNASFDMGFIKEELTNVKRRPLTNKVVDTLLFSRQIFPTLNTYKLQDLAVRFGIKALEAHRAEDDARVCMDLFNVLLKNFLERDPQNIKRIRENYVPEPIIEEVEEKDFNQDLFD